MLYEFHSSGTLDGITPTPSLIPTIDYGILVKRVQTLAPRQQLGGWNLADEPYGGTGAQQVDITPTPPMTITAGRGVREVIHVQLKDIKDTIEAHDPYREDHPIYCVIRGAGNYHFANPDFNPLTPTPDPVYDMWVLDELSDVADYIIDDLYLMDYNYDYEDLPDWLGRCVLRTKSAINFLVNPDPALVPTKYHHNIHAWLLTSQGQRFGDYNYSTGVYTPLNNEHPGTSADHGYLTEEQLRYVNYAPWINGAQGAGFLFLSKSDDIAFTRAYNISEEAYYVSKYLMESDAGIEAELRTSNGAYAQFILRSDPLFTPTPGNQNSDKLMLMVCNNSGFDTDVEIKFPDTTTFGGVAPLPTELPWNYSTTGHKIELEMNAWTARAFTVFLEYR